VWQCKHLGRGRGGRGGRGLGSREGGGSGGLRRGGRVSQCWSDAVAVRNASPAAILLRSILHGPRLIRPGVCFNGLIRIDGLISGWTPTLAASLLGPLRCRPPVIHTLVSP
jgi:hypothetical protein